MSDRTTLKSAAMVFRKKIKKHPIKNKVVVNKYMEETICIAEDCGKMYDFKLYKDTIEARILERIKLQADSGDQEISKVHKKN
ncbi:MAG: hypothetical protein LBM75_02400 [Myxococcales bacterium]|jgi:hypothetical protein|nr:hypothetical protein [Myxococcales bacterium]